MKHVWKTLVLLFALALALSLAAAPAAAADKTYRVAYIARAQADSFAAWLANAVKAEAEKYPNIALSIFDGEANDEKENAMIENAITNKFDCIIVQPNNGEAQRPYVEKIV
jgi:inositol transport system substrate-binding protein